MDDLHSYIAVWILDRNCSDLVEKGDEVYEGDGMMEEGERHFLEGLHEEMG